MFCTAALVLSVLMLAAESESSLPTSTAPLSYFRVNRVQTYAARSSWIWFHALGGRTVFRRVHGWSDQVSPSTVRVRSRVRLTHNYSSTARAFGKILWRTGGVFNSDTLAILQDLR